MSNNETAVIKKRDYAEIIHLKDPMAMEQSLNEPMSFIAASITGGLAAGVTELSVSAGRIVQGAIKGKLYEQFSREIIALRDKGKISDKFPDDGSSYESRTWVELMSDIDEGANDTDRLDAMKAMFYAVNKINASDAEKMVGYQLFQIAKKLNSGELLLLKAIYERNKEGAFGHGQQPYIQWANTVLAHLGHTIVGLIQKHEPALIQNCLITDHPQTGGVLIENGRLTDLGIRFCHNIDKYQVIKKEVLEEKV